MKFKWIKIKQDAFDKIEHILAQNNLLTYLGFNEELKIHIDARDLRLGAVISQKGKTIAFYSSKLNKTKKSTHQQKGSH